MGTYFPMSNDQTDASTMLYLRDRLATSNSETPIFPTNTIMYTNYSSSMDIHPVASDSTSTSQQEVLLNFGGLQAVGNQWKNDNRNEMLMMHSTGENSGVIPNLQGQGLSLSLGTNVPSVLQMSNIQYENNNPDFSVLGRNMSFENENSFHTKQTRDNNEYMLSSVPSNSDVANEVAPYGVSSTARGVINSKYLKAAQQLLDEVVYVKKESFKEKNARNESMKESKEIDGELRNAASDSSTAAGSSVPSELSVAEKHELQNKITKLLSMLDEVDRRYRQYYHQMQIVVSSFDVIAGNGAAKPYTSVALQTISRHFRCLRDAINAQINGARKGLGEEDASFNDNNKGVGISRLRYVDQQLRQQRAIQQLGIMQQHAWRPQRGLPETSVSILRAWLFEHFLHPYPKDSEKIMLARQTGLTRSQVSNWFINARVRLWKPMVEEMYKEEAGDADMDSNSSSEKTNTKDDKDECSQQGTTSTGQLLESKSDHQVTNTEIMGLDTNNSILQNYGIGSAREGQNSLFADPNCGGDRFISAAYHISELERFGGNVSSSVSLTLGLQQNHDTANHGFNPMRDGDGYNNGASAMANETADFECMDSGNRPHQFVSSLLPSFSRLRDCSDLSY